MTRDHDVDQKRLRNYRLMFKGALVCLLFSLALTAFGAVRAVVASQADWLLYGLLMLIWSVGSGYLTVDSTVRIIEVEFAETQEVRPRSE